MIDRVWTENDERGFINSVGNDKILIEVSSTVSILRSVHSEQNWKQFRNFGFVQEDGVHFESATENVYEWFACLSELVHFRKETVIGFSSDKLWLCSLPQKTR